MVVGDEADEWVVMGAGPFQRKAFDDAGVLITLLLRLLAKPNPSFPSLERSYEGDRKARIFHLSVTD